MAKTSTVFKERRSPKPKLAQAKESPMIVTRDMLPAEFDMIHTGRGTTMKGWDYNRDELAAAYTARRMLNPEVEFGTNYCPWNCDFCFTEDPANPAAAKLRLGSEMTLERKLSLIDELADLGVRGVNFIGAGEPTIEPNFWLIIDKMRTRDITPIVYTEASLRCTDEKFVQRLYESDVTVVVKVNSLEDEAYQNAVVRGPAGRKAARTENYFQQRNRAIALLFGAGFNQADPTRLAFDTIICQNNRDEIPRLHRYVRDHNIFVLLKGYFFSGRSADGREDALSRDELAAVFRELAEIDAREYGLVRGSQFPFAGMTPCSMQPAGLHIKIDGTVHRCAGETDNIGNVKEPGTLATVWEHTRDINFTLDGTCPPRAKFWNNETSAAKPTLSIFRKHG